jgi:hypothetical protein
MRIAYLTILSLHHNLTQLDSMDTVLEDRLSPLHSLAVFVLELSDGWSGEYASLVYVFVSQSVE